MIFTTFQFLAFFLVLFPLYFAVPKSWRHALLLIASYYFYMCSVPWYIAVIMVITLVDFVAGIRIEQAATKRAKGIYLALSIVCNFGILFAFKYAGFFAHNFNDALGLDVPVLNYVLPLGISFHTFQAVSYTIEVYRGRCPAERNLLKYSLYVAFFPQMVAGPIERPYNLLAQFHQEQRITFERFRSGLQLALWGLFKKVCVADLVAPAVNTVYAAPDQFSGPILILATFFFAVQIYCDFSGYSDIAIGVARLMGFDLMVNFRQPYFSRSVGEFWRRWHISLSSWFRDYLYIPLGGNRVGVPRHYVNIMIVFLVSGLWHGANWTFAIWGGLHGLYIVCGALTAPLRDRFKAAIGLSPENRLLAAGQIATTFALVTLAWVFFRAASVGDAVSIIARMPDWRGFQLGDLFSLGVPRFEMATAFALISIVAAVEWCMSRRPALITTTWNRRAFRWVCYYACTLGVVFFGVFARMEFIYFQF